MSGILRSRKLAFFYVAQYHTAVKFASLVSFNLQVHSFVLSVIKHQFNVSGNLLAFIYGYTKRQSIRSFLQKEAPFERNVCFVSKQQTSNYAFLNP